MMPRHMVQWRIYVYANSLYSLPDRKTSDFRGWSPQYFRRNPFEVHRVMMWVNRDVSVLIRNRKADVFYLYETIKNLLPRLSLDSTHFRKSMIHFFGAKTELFIHELINFARSPYDDLVAYECNTQYRALLEVDNGPSTSSLSRDREFLSSRLHNFVDFTRRINYDDCGGFEADLALENEDYGELDNMLVERYSAPFLMKMDGQVVTARIIPSSQANASNQGQLNPQTQSQAQQAATQPSQAVAQPAQQAVQQSQQSGQQLAHQHGSSSAGMAPSLEDLELEVAIERSMFEGAAQGAGGQGSDLILANGRVLRFANGNTINHRAVRHPNGNGSGSGVMNPPPPPPLAIGTSSAVPNHPRNASTQRARRRRMPNQR
ncbi:uncharacterized protein LOC6530995 [Drosophila yakuba]|uniref:RING-type E3 ubiquitin transferase n=1 Tax=Drosophila yakuba TaxID=7245 RepID=B4PBR1_DROYA|nr:uncharacterized protein LOC6530995 [Drosophila yakuba]XP_039228081.1 uncharacterized protein LOC6530995 [Drosophila yakuba]EDW91545.1 uncharacterized protein Dyak_GE12015 [Drosophila yakuba]